MLLNHADPTRFGAAGMLGVALFFTLSGFLITGLLLSELRTTGRVDYRRFFIARALRLLPALLLVLVGYTVVEGAFDHGDGRELVGATLVSGLTYTTNLPIAPQGAGSMYHLWTLATEEQFYLLWPLLLSLAWRRRVVERLLAIGIVVALLGCALTLAAQSQDVARVYALPTSWAATLLIGCWARVLHERGVTPIPTRANVRVLLGATLALLLIAGSLLPAQGAHPWTYLVTLPLVAVGSAMLILLAWTAAGIDRRLLRPLVALGTVSYAAYLWNLPVHRWLGDGHPVLGTALTLIAATVSWWLVERPVAAWRRRATGPTGSTPPPRPASSPPLLPAPGSTAGSPPRIPAHDRGAPGSTARARGDRPRAPEAPGR